MINTPEEFIYLRNSENPDEYLRAAHEEASDEVWLEIIQKYPEMKKWVIQNKTVPVKILNILSEDKEQNIRFLIAMKRKCDFELFLKLSNDNDPYVRQRVAMNPKVPKEILEKLSEDKCDFIVEVANERLSKFA